MEIALIAAMGFVGYYLNDNDHNTNDDKRKKSKILSNDVPDGFDVYNQNRLSLSEEKEKVFAGISYNKSQDPRNTNIIPNYYNQLGPLINRSRLDKSAKQARNINQLYDADEDLDDIYSDDLSSSYSTKAETPNNVFKANYYDRDHRLLSDLYEEHQEQNRQKPLVIPGVAKVQRKTFVDPATNRPVNTPKKFRTDSDIFVVESFGKTKPVADWQLDSNGEDPDLLSVSESLTDNSDALRKILTGKPKHPKGEFGLGSPESQKKYKRLIGVKPDYQVQILDDENAKYPRYKGVPETSYPQIKEFNEQFPQFREIEDVPEIVPDYPSYIAQFDEQTYDTNGLPSAPNDIFNTSNKVQLSDLERQLSYDGGWTQYDQKGSMAYGIVPDNELIHDNMMPYFSRKTGYGTNDLLNTHAMDYKKELFTGNLSSEWHKKNEIPRMFPVVADAGYVYGTPIRPEGEESRYQIGRWYQNESLKDPERITPGLNLNYNEIGTGGYNEMVRVLPKTVDELRTTNNPKESYEGRTIMGMKGQARAVQAEVISYRPDGFKVTTEADLLPKSVDVSGPKTRDNYVMKETDRANQQMEYTGGAFTNAGAVDQNMPEYMRSKVKNTTKATFTLPKPLQKFAKGETEFNPNFNSYENFSTIRSTTEQKEHMGIASSATNGFTNIQDNAKETIKQSTATVAHNVGLAKSNTMRGTVHAMDVANPTIQEMTIENQLNPHATSLNTGHGVYNSDLARTTTRESTESAVEPNNATSDFNIYANYLDSPKITLKQTVVQIPQNTQVLAIGQQQGATEYQDLARPTIGETTVNIPYQTMTVPVNRQQGAVGYSDTARQTIKSTTSNIPQQTMTAPVGQQQRTPNLQDKARTTTNESTNSINRESFVTPVNQQQRTSNYTQNAKTTLKQDTVQIQQNTFSVPVDQAQGARGYQDTAKPTLKSVTTQIQQNTFAVPVGQSQRTSNYQDNARTTIGESTNSIQRETFINMSNQHQRTSNYTDNARATLKSITGQVQQNTFSAPVDQAQGARGYSDVAKTTQKEGVQIPYPMRAAATGQSIHSNLQDVAKTTQKEGVQITYPVRAAATGQSIHSNLQDVAKTTQKEGVQIPYPVRAAATGQSIHSNLQDIAKMTQKEGVQIPYPTRAAATGQSIHSNLQDVAKTTQKEGTQTPAMMRTTATCQSIHSNLQDVAKMTQKEGIQIPYPTRAAATNQSIRTNLQDIAKTTTKEGTIDQEFVGMPTNDVNSKGYGYITEKPYVPNTTRQFTGQEMFVNGPEGDDKPRSYCDAYNAKRDDRKEMTQVYHAPTLSNVDLGPNKDMSMSYVRDDNNRTASLIMGSSVNNNLDRPVQQGSVSAPKLNVPATMYMNPGLAAQLNNNPYNIPYYGTYKIN
uniref:Uncharacterized protein n=1 Tax=viral metagenome TaxID=1070528 RepID=A0A6C0CAR8_9ZZZZ